VWIYNVGVLFIINTTPFQDGRVCTGLIWLRIGTGGGLL
jgi:hypothetical protein